jgi:uncharacterized protein with FMN-binding domain
MPARALVAIMATVVGVFLLFSFQPSGIGAIPPPLSQNSPASTAASPAAGGTAPPSPAAGSATPSSAPSGLKDGTFQGQDFPNNYGDVQVAIVISGGKITDVQTLQMPSDRQRSAEISQAAAPILHDEVIQAQSAQIDTLSGATFTSDSYVQSLQSALDKAHS